MSAPANGRGGALTGLAMGLPRDKADTLLLLGAALMVLVPHAGHLPFWVSALCAVTLLWRALITLRGTRMPPVLMLLPISLAAMGGVYMTFHTLLGRDAGVAMLVLLVAFKTLEMHARRDLFVVVFLCLFLVLTNFFYSQSFLTAVMMIGSVIALLTAQLSFQFTGAVPPLRRRFAMACKVFGLAAPLALVLFVVFPRIQGPLWGMPGDAHGASTGLSNSMSPGNMSNLANSMETAFRVRFLDPVPPQKQLYWRGVVLGEFDGRTWNRTRRSVRSLQGNFTTTVRGAAIRHQVTLEPNNNRWLFALDLPQALPELVNNAALVSDEFELSAAQVIHRRIRYDVASHVDYNLGADHQLNERERWLGLPPGFNPRALQAGLDLQRLADPVDRVTTVLRQFNQGNFVYTMQPPLLGRHTVDEFLYGSRAGFCEHYSSAFVVLMRAADVPARVVTGYQGGEMNPVDGILEVRQSDAHAWAEVWIEQRGWVRVDPTAAVAPERVERSTASVRPPEPFGMEALGNFINLNDGTGAWLQQLRYRMEALDNSWSQWVLNYTPERQRGFLESLQATLLQWQSAAVLGVLASLFFIARAIRSRREKDPIDALYSTLCQRMGQLGMGRALDEGPSAYAARLATLALPAEKKSALARFLQLYSAHKYAARPTDGTLLPTLKSLLNTI